MRTWREDLRLIRWAGTRMAALPLAAAHHRQYQLQHVLWQNPKRIQQIVILAGKSIRLKPISDHHQAPSSTALVSVLAALWHYAEPGIASFSLAVQHSSHRFAPWCGEPRSVSALSSRRYSKSTIILPGGKHAAIG